MEPNVTMARHAATRDLLGAFALGAVDADEAAAVREHLATCAECQGEIAGLWAAVDSLPDLIVPMDPPPALRDRIAAAIMAEPVPAAAPGSATPGSATPGSAPAIPAAPLSIPAIAPVETPSGPLRKPAAFWSRATPGSRATPWAAAAAILLLLSAGLLGWNLRLQQQVRQAAPVVETIALAPTDVAPAASGEVTYHADDALFIVAVRDLPPLEADQVYEVWLIGEDGPEPAGVFDQPTDQHAIVADRGQYETLAITVEPGPLGTQAPTGEVVASAPL